MGRRLRYLPHPLTTFEITIRCVQGRLLLRPSKKLNEIVLGIIGRAQERWPEVQLHLLVVASNHMHLLLSVPDSKSLSGFMCFVNSNLAREAGRLHGWREKFWGRRYTAVAVLDEGALEGRVRYILSHGCKEDLVRTPKAWPGVQCVGALCRGERLRGVWYDRTRQCRARSSGRVLSDEEVAVEYEVRLTPPTGWSEWSAGRRRRKVQQLVREVAAEHEARRRRQQKGVLGARRVLEQHPHAVPVTVKRTRAPLCHCSRPELLEEYRRGYREFCLAFREAAGRLRQEKRLVAFPEHSFPPSVGYWEGEADRGG